MPRKCKYTKEQLIEAALNLIEEGGVELCSARNLTKRLGATQATIFTHFSSMDEIKEEAMHRIFDIYDGLVKEGMSTSIPFKGYGMATFRFAKRYPNYYKALFLSQASPVEILTLLEKEGHFDVIVDAAMATFHLKKDEAVWLYKQLIILEFGVCTLQVTKTTDFTDEQVSEIIGTQARALVREIHANPDRRVMAMPGKDEVDQSSLNDYLKEGE